MSTKNKTQEEFSLMSEIEVAAPQIGDTRRGDARGNFPTHTYIWVAEAV